MSSFLKAAAFCLALVGLYTFYSVAVIPPVTPEPPPAEGPSWQPVTLEEMVELGRQVYEGKGACALCHAPSSGRAPALEAAAIVARERVREAGYKGRADDAEGYLYESVVEPSAHVVAGFGVVGSRDSVSPMPAATDPSIGLTEAEIRAVVAYLQRLSGVEVTAGAAGGKGEAGE